MSTDGTLAADIRIEEWRPGESAPSGAARDIDALGDILHAVVHGGAGVSFVVPFSKEEACGFWRDKVLPGVRARTRRVLVARRAGLIVGTVQVDLTVPPNQRHRAEVVKLLVHPSRQTARDCARSHDCARAGSAV